MTTAKTSQKKTATKARTGAKRGAKPKNGATAPTKREKATVAATKADVKAMEATPPKERKPTLLDAAVRLLRESGEALGAKDMATKIIAAGWWETKGKTPEATLYSAIIREISGKGAESRFHKVGRGRFELTAAGKEG